MRLRVNVLKQRKLAQLKLEELSVEKKGNKLVGIFDAQAQALIQVGELKAAGYEEEEIYLVAKHDEQIDLLIEYTGVYVDTQDRDNFKGKVMAFLAGEDITKNAFNRMGLSVEETDYYFQQVENGKLLLHANRKPTAVLQAEAAVPADQDSIAGKDSEEDKEIITERRPLSEETDAEKEEQVLTPKQAYEKGDAIYIPLSEERLDIGKKKVVREEIVIGKRKVKDVQIVNQTVRREAADVEENGTVHKADK